MNPSKNYTSAAVSHTNTSPSEAPVVVCVSGGADSVALLHKALFSQLDILDGRGISVIQHNRIAVFHLNHCLRGADSDADEAYVRQLCKKYNLPSRIVRVDVNAKAAQFGGNIENAGREIRYAEAYSYAQSLCEDAHLPLSEARILTAHTADDRAESFLMNAMRGSGLRGLSSIARRNNIICRPLLHLTHEDLEKWLIDHDIAWRVDLTNKDTSYLRSYVRYNVLPPIKERFPDASLKMSAMCDVLHDDNDYIESEAQRAFDAALKMLEDDCIGLELQYLKSLHIALMRRLIINSIMQLAPDARITSHNIKDVTSVLDNEKTSVTVCENIDVRCENGVLYFRRLNNLTPPSVRLEVPGKARFGDVTIISEILSCNDFVDAEEYIRQECIKGKGDTAFIDLSKVTSSPEGKVELVIESIKPGDIIHPYGMGGKTKLVSDLLHEVKIPTHKRKQIPLVKDSITGAIVCVSGIRTDEEFSCRKTTQEFIQLKFHRE